MSCCPLWLLFCFKLFYRYPFTWLNMRPGNIVQICTCVTTLRTPRPTTSKPTYGQPCLKAKTAPVCRKAWWLLEEEEEKTSSLTKIYIFFFCCTCVVCTFVSILLYIIFFKAESANVSSLPTSSLTSRIKLIFLWTWKVDLHILLFGKKTANQLFTAK